MVGTEKVREGNGRLVAIVVLAVCFLSGCASVPLATSDLDSRAKAFVSNPKKSTIYLFRDEIFGSAVLITVSLDGRVAGQTASKTYFVWTVDPGPHRVVSHSENVAFVDLDTEPARLYFIWQEINFGLWQPRTTLHLVDEARGKAGVMASRRAGDLFFANE